MKYLLPVVLLCISPLSLGNDLTPLVKDLQDRKITLETIAALVELDNPRLKIGYGLCEAAGRPLCTVDSSLGYGLCKVADGNFCKKNGSLGYGLCELTGAMGCKENGSLGYGMCIMAGEKNCKP
jgi:hypothetical protein